MRRTSLQIKLCALLTVAITACRNKAPPEPDPAILLRASAIALEEGGGMLDEVVERLAGAPIVLVGTPSLGTREFEETRAALTRRLVRERGFSVLALEAGWSEAARVDRYVRGLGADRSGREALADLGAFPSWRYQNAAVLALVEELRAYNLSREPGEAEARVVGLDVMPAGQAASAVVEHLDASDPEAADRARARYACTFEGPVEPASLSDAAHFEAHRPCTTQLQAQVEELRQGLDPESAPAGSAPEREARFSALQEALAVRTALAVHQAGARSPTEAWNLRVRHMAEALQEVRGHLEAQAEDQAPPKVIVWGHTRLAGDARGTAMGDQGASSLGQLLRQRHGGDVVRLGFTTNRGTVAGARRWGGPMEAMSLEAAPEGSYEALLAEVGLPRFLLDLREAQVATTLRTVRTVRLLGPVSAAPGAEPSRSAQTPLHSEWERAILPEQLDLVLHVEETSAARPLAAARRPRS